MIAAQGHDRARRRARRLVAASGLSWLGLVGATWSAPAEAEEPARSSTVGETSTSAAQRAIELGHTGLLAFENGRMDDAYAAFLQAEAWAHSPVFLLHLARAAWRLGRLREALDLYTRCGEEPLDDDSPEPWRQASAAAQVERGAVLAIIPSLRVSWSGGVTSYQELTIELQTAGASVVVMQDQLEPGETSRFLYLDPGTYSLRLTGPGNPWKRDIMLARGAHLGLHVCPPIAPLRERPVVRAPRPTPSTDSPVLRYGAYAAWASGSALLLGSAISGGIAWGLARDVRSQCSEGTCPRQDYQRAQQALQLGRLATAGLVSGLLGVATGTVLFAWPLRSGANVRVSAQGAGLAWEGSF